MRNSIKRPCGRVRVLLRRWPALLLAVALLGRSASAARAEVKRFTGASSAAWEEPLNWSPPGAAQAGDDVLLDAGLIVELRADAAVHSLTLAGGTLSGGGTLTVTDGIEWTSGAMIGGGATLVLGALNLLGADDKVLDRRLSVAGTTAWPDDGNLRAGASARIVNLPGAVWTVAGNGSFLADAVGARFDNRGSFVSVAPRQLRFDSVAFDNAGTVSVHGGGTLVLAGGGNHGGSFEAPDASLEFAGGLHEFAATSRIAAATVRFTAGRVLVRGTYAATDATIVDGAQQVLLAGTVLRTGSLRIAAGTVVLDAGGDRVSAPQLVLSGGALTGAADLEVTGALTWTGGILSGPGAIDARGTLVLAGDSAKVLNRPLRNFGTALWGDSGVVTLSSGARLQNAAEAAFVIEAEATISAFGGTPRFENAGTLRKIASTQVLFSGVGIDNTGTVDVQEGSLLINGPYSQSGGLTRLGGGTLQSSYGVEIAAGRLEGIGVVEGSVTTMGDVAPQRLVITGNFTQGPSATLKVDVDPTGPALSVGGIAHLGGSLEIALASGVQPSSGEVFSLMRYGSSSGEFETLRRPPTGIGEDFVLRVDAAELALQYVRENCGDGLDNDGDGEFDCGDAKCVSFAACGFTRTPTLVEKPTASPSPTASATATNTPSPPPPLRCAGDCDGDGEVSIDELLLGANIVVGAVAADACPAFDANADAEVDVGELVLAVTHALDGCPGNVPTPSASPLPPRPGEWMRVVAQNSGVVVNTAEALPMIVSALTTSIRPDLAPAAGGSASCPLGGSIDRTGQVPNLGATLRGCRLQGAHGVATLDGSVDVGSSSFAVRVRGRLAADGGLEIRRVAADLVGTLSLTPGTGCGVRAARLRIAGGTLSVERNPGQAWSMDLRDTTIALRTPIYNGSCWPVAFRAAFEGPATLRTSVDSGIDVEFAALELEADDTTEPGFLALSGGIASACAGGPVSVASDPSLDTSPDRACPAAGTIRAFSRAASGTLAYRGDGSIGLDADGDGTEDDALPRCLPPDLVRCAGTPSRP